MTLFKMVLEQTRGLMVHRCAKLFKFSISANNLINEHPWKVISTVLCVNVLLGLFACSSHFEIRLQDQFLPEGSQSEMDRTFLGSVIKDNPLYERQIIAGDQCIEMIYTIDNTQSVSIIKEAKAYTNTMSNVFAAYCPNSSRIKNVACSGLASVIILRSYAYKDFYETTDSYIKYPFIYSFEENRWVYFPDRVHVKGQGHYMEGFKWKYCSTHPDKPPMEAYTRLFDKTVTGSHKPSVYTGYIRDETLYKDFKENCAYFIGAILVTNGLAVMMVMSRGNGLGLSAVILLVQMLSSTMAVLAGIGIGTMFGHTLSFMIPPLLSIFIHVFGVVRLLQQLSTPPCPCHQGNTDDHAHQQPTVCPSYIDMGITFGFVLEQAVLGAGMMSSMKGVRYMCFYFGVSEWISLANQTTFVPACLHVLRRMESSKLGSSSRVFISTNCMERKLPKSSVIFHETPVCNGESTDGPNTSTENEHGFKRILHRVITSDKSLQIGVLLVACLYVGYMISYATSLDFQDRDPKMGTKTSDLHSFLTRDLNFENTKLISFIIHKPIQYSSVLYQSFINDLIRVAQMDPNIHDTYSINWLEEYKQWDGNDFRYNSNNESSFVFNLYHTKAISNYEGDYRIDNETGPVVYSRFYVLGVDLTTSKVKSDLMYRLRELAAESPLPVTVFSPDFILYEQHYTIRTVLMKVIVLPTTCFLLIAYTSLPINKFHVGYITGCSLSTLVCVMGSMSILTIPFNFLTVQPVLAISIISTSVSALLCFEQAQNRYPVHSFCRKKTTERLVLPILKTCVCVFIGMFCIYESPSYVLHCIFWIFVTGIFNISFQSSLFPLLTTFFDDTF